MVERTSKEEVQTGKSGQKYRTNAYRNLENNGVGLLYLETEVKVLAT